MHAASLEAIRRILGRRISSVLIVTQHNRHCTGREFFTRLYLGFDDGLLYEFWIHATDELHGAKGVDRETGLVRVRREARDPGMRVEALFLDPAEQAEAERILGRRAYNQRDKECPEHLPIFHPGGDP